jgi:hypothetical protein
MPRRSDKITQADIARAIRAAREAGAHSVTIDSEGLIRIELIESIASNDPNATSTTLGLPLRHCDDTLNEPTIDEARSEDERIRCNFKELRKYN